MPRIKNIILAAVYFGLSTMITGWFIFIGKDFYNTFNSMVLSGSIAGAKWGLQILMALFFLKSRKWKFIKNIGFVCLIGSLLLFSFYPIGYFGITGGLQFAGALGVAILGMVISYYKTVQDDGFPIEWFLGWVSCLIIAITLQLTVVFHLI